MLLNRLALYMLLRESNCVAVVCRRARVQFFTAFSAMFFISRVLIFPVLVFKG